MNTSSNNQNIQSLFIKGVHHSSTSVIYITQNMFNSGRFARDITEFPLHVHI